MMTGTGEEHYTGKMVWSLKALMKALKEVTVRSIEFHSRRGDFERWVRLSLHDSMLAERLKKIGTSNLKGRKLKKSIIKAVEKRLEQ